MRKPKTDKQRDRERDHRLRKVYGISLEEYEELLEKARGVCKICGRPPVTVRLSVDHDHSWKKIKIETEQSTTCWYAAATYNGKRYLQIGNKKSEAVRDLKKELKRASVRGIICVWCNLGLKRYRDNSEALKSAAYYLEDFACGSPFSGLEPK